MTAALALAALALLGDAPAEAPPVDPGRLARASSLIQPGGRRGTLGPWRLLTDVADRDQLASLNRVASHLTEAYQARFGLDAQPRAGETIVLFARDESYRQFSNDVKELTATRGHAGGGLAAALAGPTVEETRPIVVHELSHLLTHSAFAAEVPGWIDEGLSEELSWSRADAEGRLLPGTLEATTSLERAGDRLVRTVSGPRASVTNFLERSRSGRVPPLSSLLAPRSMLLTDPGMRRDGYTQAGLLVRFLLQGDPARAERFRVFLRAAAIGAPAGLDDLALAVGTDAKSLEREYWTFVRGL